MGVSPGAAGLQSHLRTGPHQSRQARSSPRPRLCSLQMAQQWGTQPLCPQQLYPSRASALVLYRSLSSPREAVPPSEAKGACCELPSMGLCLLPQGSHPKLSLVAAVPGAGP